MPQVHFDATVPVELQLTDFSCSVGATYWCLRSVGVSVTQQQLQDVMVPELVSPDLGLLDGSGATLAGLLRDWYGLAATHQSEVTFDAVSARAGRQPIALGGGRWFVTADGSVTGHWVAVRGFDGTRLILANPGGTGPNFGQQSLDRAAFEQRAPCAAVWIDVAGAAPTTPSGVGSFRVGRTDGRGVNVRADPSTTARIVGRLADGAEVNVGDHAWRAVQAAGGAQGWIANEYLVAADGGFRIADTGGSGANLRQEPDAAAMSLGVMAEGTDLTGGEHAWRQVVGPGGVNGWVADEFLVTD